MHLMPATFVSKSAHTCQLSFTTLGHHRLFVAESRVSVKFGKG